jgi:hypothetical protein
MKVFVLVKPKKLVYTYDCDSKIDGITYTDVNIQSIINPESVLTQNVEDFRRITTAWALTKPFDVDKIKMFRDVINFVEEVNNDYFKAAKEALYDSIELDYIYDNEHTS